MNRNKQEKECIKDSEAGILDMITWVANYNDEELVNKLCHLKFSKLRIKLMVCDMVTYSGKLSKQLILLRSLSQTYNNAFAAEIKQKQLNSIIQCFEKLKKTMDSTKITFAKFKEALAKAPTLKDSKQVSPCQEKENQLESLPKNFFTEQGIEDSNDINPSYKECSELLCDKVEEFYQLVLACLMMCQTLIQEEKRITGDVQELKLIYDTCFDNALETIQNAIELIDPNKLTEEENRRAEECSANMQQFLIKYFHNMTNLEFTRHVMAVKILSHKKENAKERSKRIALFPDNLEKEQKVMMTIRALDKLNLESRLSASTGKRQFTTKTVIALKDQFGYEGAMEGFVAYLKQNYQGNLDFPKASALSTEKGNEYKLANKSDLESKRKWEKVKRVLDTMKRNIQIYMEGNRLDEMLNNSYSPSPL